MQIGLNNLGLTGASNRFSPASLFTAGEQGVWYEAYDPNSIATRRNYLTYSEDFSAARGGLSGLATTSTLTGYDSAVAFGYDGVTTSYALRSMAYTSGVAGISVVFGAVVQMDDGGVAPVIGPSITGADSDLSLVIANENVVASRYTTSSLGGGKYFIQGWLTPSTANSNVGIYKYSTNSSRTFKVTAFFFQKGTSLSLSNYQKVTDWNTEYLNIAPRTNLIDYSETLTNAVWVSGGAPITARTDGSYEVVESTANSQHYFGQFLTTTISNGASASMVVRAKTAGVTTISLVCGFSSASFNLSTGVASGASGCSAMMVDAGDGYYDCILYNIVASSASSVIVYLTSNAMFPGSGGSIYVKRMQLNITANPVAYQTTPYSVPANSIPLMYQDTTCNTPVTAVEQPVGFLSDKRTNWITRTNYAWTKSSGDGTVTYSPDNKTIMITGATTLTRVDLVSPLAVSGVGTQIMSVTLVSVSGGTASFWNRGSPVPISQGQTISYGVNIANSSVDAVQLSAGSAVFQINYMMHNTGNHAKQSTTAARPTLSARYNTLTKTEQFDDAAWTKVVTTISSNATTDPLGGSTADKVQENDTTAIQHYVYAASQQISGVSNTFTVRVKAAERPYCWLFGENGSNALAYFDLVNGTIGTTSGSASGRSAGIRSLGNGWYECKLVWTATTTGATFFGVGTAQVDNNFSPVGVVGSGIYVWGADFRSTSDAALSIPAYQRVNTSTDYDTNGFPHYLKFDGVDDSMGAVDLAMNNVSCHAVAGVINTAVGTVANFTDGITNRQIIGASTGPSEYYRMYQLATLGYPTPRVPGTTDVLVGNFNADATSTLQLNGTTLATGNAGTGVLVGLRLGADNGGFTQLLNGRIYAAVLRDGGVASGIRPKLVSYLGARMGKSV